MVGTYDGLILHLDLSTATERRNFALRGHEKGVFCLVVLGLNRVISGSGDRSIRIWDLTTREAVRVLVGHDDAVTGLASISSRVIASASQDHTIKLWDLETGGLLSNLHLDTGLSSLAAMPDGRTLVAGDAAGTMHFLRLEGGNADGL